MASEASEAGEIAQAAHSGQCCVGLAGRPARSSPWEVAGVITAVLAVRMG